jgi:hypothetical protein
MPGANRKKLLKSAKRVAQSLQRQKLQAKLERQQKRAQAAIKSFRVKKSDFGKYHFITTKGGRGAANKGRAGYMVYVTKGGKKKPVKNFRSKEPFRPTKVTNFKFKKSKVFRTPQKNFEQAQLELTRAGDAVNRGSGKVNISGVYDFSDSVVRKIARGIQTVINRQQSRRSFLLDCNVLVELPDGTTQVIHVRVPIAKQERVEIQLAGLFNFVKRKFYAYMARELAYVGFVSSGSANHVRRLAVNKGKSKARWEQGDGQRWRGNESQIVKIRRIEWRMYQAK